MLDRAVKPSTTYGEQLKILKGRKLIYTYEYVEISKEDCIRAGYLHGCLKRVNRDYVTNSSLRERFNINEKNSSMISRLLNKP